jgi:hypothetical protein
MRDQIVMHDLFDLCLVAEPGNGNFPGCRAR